MPFIASSMIPLPHAEKTKKRGFPTHMTETEGKHPQENSAGWRNEQGELYLKLKPRHGHANDMTLMISPDAPVSQLIDEVIQKTADWRGKEVTSKMLIFFRENKEELTNNMAFETSTVGELFDGGETLYIHD
jgi:hypothetical protein